MLGVPTDCNMDAWKCMSESDKVEIFDLSDSWVCGYSVDLVCALEAIPLQDGLWKRSGLLGFVVLSCFR